MQILKGAEVSAKIREEIGEMMADWRGAPPKLAIIRIGENPDDLSYERGARKKMASLGLTAEVYAYPKEIQEREFKEEFKRINENPDVDGILLLRPLPEYINERDIVRMIDPQKDLDGICPENTAKVFAGDGEGFAPCTAEAVIEVLKAYEIPIEGKRVTIVGRSMVVGRPLSMLFLKENATVTICHTRTADLRAACRNGEILVAAAGKARLLDGSFVGDQGIVIDVGIHADENGTLCGDVDFDSIKEKASMATPVPGGVGAVTTAVLARHLVLAARKTRQVKM